MRVLVFEDRTAIGDEPEIWSFKKMRMTLAKHEEEKANEIEAAVDSQDPKARLRAILDRRQRQQGDSVQQVYGLLEHGAALAAVRTVSAQFREYQKLLASHADIRKKEN